MRFLLLGDVTDEQLADGDLSGETLEIDSVAAAGLEFKHVVLRAMKPNAGIDSPEMIYHGLRTFLKEWLQVLLLTNNLSDFGIQCQHAVLFRELFLPLFSFRDVHDRGQDKRIVSGFERL